MAYLMSLLAGIGVGIAYALIGVRSPAPPIIALIGLLGIVLGETGTALLKQHLGHAVQRTTMSSIEHPR